MHQVNAELGFRTQMGAGKGEKLAKRGFSKQDICSRRDGNKKKKSKGAREAESVGRGALGQEEGSVG